jgi:hypothetical protein
MSTVRRLYFYGLALISVEVVIWGVINLVRTVVSKGIIGAGSLLATGLSLVLVGLPIFWLHWRTVQRDAQRDQEEHSSRIRAVFLYAALFAVQIPIVYAILAMISRWLTTLLGQPASSAWFGGEGTALDNLIAIVINAIALAYFWFILRADWQADLPESHLADTRRLYRYLWVLFGLTLTIVGVYNLLYYLLATLGQSTQLLTTTLAGGISLLLVGAPLWAYHWWAVQSALSVPDERRSLLRLVVLYLISLAGVIGVLTPTGEVLNSLFRWILGESTSLVTFLRDNSGYIGAAIPLGVMWWYYGQILNEEVAAMPDQPRREALRRLYNYILSLLGQAVSFFGLINLVEFLAQVSISRQPVIGSLSSMLSGALAALLVGLPLWLIPWRKMQQEAARMDEAGDRARRSVLRRTYLYLVLFLLVIGAMGFTGQLLYTLLNGLFSGAGQSLALDATTQFLSLVIDVALLVYHWRVLRQDGRMAQQTLGDLHAAFPTLVLLEGDGLFGDALIQAFQRVSPRLPVALHPVERGAPDEAMLGVKAVLLPIGLALTPPESLRLWLEEYHGRRILLPLPAEGWFWLGQSEKRDQDLARETAQAIRQIAEGELVRQTAPSNPWAIAGYVLGGLFGLMLLSLVFSIMISTLFR